MVPRVRDEQRLLVEKDQSLRVGKPDLVEAAVRSTSRARSSDSQNFRRAASFASAGYHDPVVAGVGDGEEVAGTDRNLSRETQGAAVDGGREQTYRGLVEGALLAMLGDHAGDLTLQLRGVALSLEGSSSVTLGVYEVERRPGAHPVLVPGGPVWVVENGMAHVVANDGALKGLVVTLVLELGRVDADDDEGVPETLFKGPELFEDVEAVNAAERPEVEEDYLAPQGPEREVLPGVDPTAPPD
jgi:hypothetical protein